VPCTSNTEPSATPSKGTLFLDEIGELPLDAQPKLLRALDGYAIKRVGERGAGERADVRVIAATHKSLASDVAESRFRRDLYHRLEAFVIEIPPLRRGPVTSRRSRAVCSSCTRTSSGNAASRQGLSRASRPTTGRET
jgi:transcriptional regulator of acetoin/glycerol metabolism